MTPPMFFNAVVQSRRALTPGMVRLTLGGEAMRAFESTGIGDEYLRLFFPDPGTGQLALPTIDERGHWSYPAGPSKVRCSTYTVRRHDDARGEIDIDFVVHEGGLASEWAQTAAVGDAITINRPRGLHAVPPGARWQLLACDATGLPALSRILERRPAIPTRAFIEVAEPSHRLALPEHDTLTVSWLFGGNGSGPSHLEQVVRGMPRPSTSGYVWVAGEQKIVRAIRRYVRQDLKLPPEQYELVGYWVAEHDWEARYEALDSAVREQIEAAWSSDRDPEEVQDEVDATFERLGL